MKNNILTILLFMLATGLAADPYSYQNNIRDYNSRTNSVFRVKKSDKVVQHKDDISIPVVTGIVDDGATGAALAFGASGNPDLSIDSDSGVAISIADGEVGSVTYRFLAPDNFATEGTISVLASSESNVTTSTKMSLTVSVDGTETVLTEAAVSAGTDETVTFDYTGITNISKSSGIVLKLGRSDGTSGTGTLNIKAIKFSYNESMVYAQ